MSKRGDNLRSPLTVEERFWTKVQRGDGCWEWTGKERVKGYGRFRPGSTQPKVLAHRFAYELLCGPIPDGLQVLHRCDNPLCVRPDHLFPGTNADNVADKVSKGRQSRLGGERNPNAKLTEQDVLEVRRRRAAGESRKVVAAAFGISPTMVSLITTGRFWRDAA